MPNSVTRAAIDLENLRRRAQHPQAGAVLIFCGDIRNHSAGRSVTILEYEAHERMALRQIDRIVEEAQQRWLLHYVEVIHRFGKMAVLDCSIATAVSSSHRADAYESSRYIIDTIKRSVPIWKKEHFEDGFSAWSAGCEASSVIEASSDPPPVVTQEALIPT
ncbi:MAG TPA: molybdenum cofactor biosynthesis protein MoaE [Deltaproteobacteria bacterium]|nr:molybdenum cofactor biosynthesis protein MoaE [Deltaproteobacteria bacterium]